MASLRVGIVGAGHLGSHHARLYGEIPGATLRGVHDLDPGRASALAHACGARAFADLDALLREVEAVSVTVPTSAHHAVAAAALRAGVHCLVEKPIASTLAAADDLIAIARARGLTLQVGHVERFNAAVLLARQILGQPLFMEGHRLAPFGPRGTDVDVILDLMIHDIDLCLSLTGDQVVRVEAVGVPVITRSEDIANARLTFSHGAVANLTASRVSRERLRKLRIFQRETYLSLDLLKGRVEVFQRGGSPDGSAAGTFRREVLERPGHQPLRAELESFCSSAGDGTPAVVTGEEAREALRVALEIQRVAREGRRCLGWEEG